LSHRLLAIGVVVLVITAILLVPSLTGNEVVDEIRPVELGGPARKDGDDRSSHRRGRDEDRNGPKRGVQEEGDHSGGAPQGGLAGDASSTPPVAVEPRPPRVSPGDPDDPLGSGPQPDQSPDPGQPQPPPASPGPTPAPAPAPQPTPPAPAPDDDLDHSDEVGEDSAGQSDD
jgi:hypothetical protein